MTNYIEIFREKLNKYKISQKKLAEAANRSQTNISEILNSKVSPSIDSRLPRRWFFLFQPEWISFKLSPDERTENSFHPRPDRSVSAR